MRQPRPRGWGWLILAAFFLPAALQAQTPVTRKDLPFRLDPAREPELNRDTVVLWRFEAGDATDTAPGGNAGVFKGSVASAPEGRFGKGVRTADRQSGLLLNSLKGAALQAAGVEGRYPLAIDFWIRLESYPAETACLLEMARQGGGTAVRVRLSARGVLALEGDGVTAAEAGGPLPLREWTHLAVQGRTLFQANYVYAQQTGIELLTNGLVAARAWGSVFPPADYLSRISLGNNLAFNAGLPALFDAFRVTCSDNGFYALARQAFVHPDQPEPEAGAGAFFQDTAVFSVGFDQPDALKAVVAPVRPQRIQTAPALRPEAGAGPVSLGGQTRAEPEPGGLVDDLAADLKKPRETDKAVAAPVGLVPGVRGRALAVRGGEARIDLPKGIDLTDGSIAFWLQPGDWDNLSAPPGRDAGFLYANARPHIVTLWGLPASGSGEPQRLVSLALSRTEGPPAPVAPEFEAYFGGPPVPLAPHRWTHVLLTWGRGLVYKQPYCLLDGAMIPYEERMKAGKVAPAEVWASHAPAYITLGNGYETVFDSLRVSAYPLDGEELFNARALYTGEPLRELGNVTARCDYRLSLGQLAATLEPLSRYKGRVKTADVCLNDPASGKTWTAAIAAFSNGAGRAVFEVGLLPEGRYPLTGTFKDQAGQTVADFAATFVRNPVPWLGNRLGYPDTPPAPFTPVTREGAAVRAVGRDYRVGADGNFEQITVGGEPILAAPVRFSATVGGTAQVLEGAGPAGFGAVQPTGATWRAEARGGGVTVATEVHFEYDGMAKYTLEVRPTGGPVTVDRLALEIPLKEEYGWLIHALPVDGDFRAYHYYGTGTLRGREGTVWNSRDFYKSGSAKKMTAGTFVPSVWLGGATRGLYWFADNDAGWVPDEEKPAVDVIWKDGVITLSLNFVAAPFRLEAPRRIVYALMATPAKPLPQAHRAWDRGDYKAHPGVAGRLTSSEAFAPWEMPVKAACMDYWPIGSDWAYARTASDRQRVSTHNKYPPGVCLMLYHDKRFVPLGPDAAYFGWEWQRDGQGAWPRSKVDCLIWNMDQWIGRTIMDGIYIDDIFPIADDNWETGSAYRLPDGRIQPGSGNFAYREYLKRLYAVMVAHGKPPVITLHSTHTLPPFFSFATAAFDGEDGGGFKADGSSTFLDVWRLDRLLALDAAERTGLVTMFMLKEDYYLKGRTRGNWEHLAYRVLRSKDTADLLFDFNRVTGGWRAPYQQPGVEALPFWRTGGVARVTGRPVRDAAAPAKPVEAGLQALFRKGIWSRDTYGAMLESEPLRVTVYRRTDNRCLVVVGNLLKEPVAATVEFDLAKLGVPADRRGAVKVSDLDDGGAAPEGVDVQTMAKPDITAVDILDKTTGINLPETGEGAPPKPLKLDGNTLALDVRAHDFRAIELQW